MNVLLIIHANSWSDKSCSAKPGIEKLIQSGDYDRIIEVASMHPDAYEGRYLFHNGTVFEHQGISPVSFFESDLFGEKASFPVADVVTLVGGVLNSTGGGCLNCAFNCLIGFQHRLKNACAINIPINAVYQAGSESWDERSVEQAAKDLAWKMLIANIPFALAVDDRATVAFSNEPLLNVTIF